MSVPMHSTFRARRRKIAIELVRCNAGTGRELRKKCLSWVFSSGLARVAMEYIA